MQKIVIAQLLYRNPKSGEEYTVQRHWPCKSQTDAEHIVKYYGMKTGALTAKCVMEELTNEEIKQASSGIITKETHQAQPIA
jgi:hypothetical protein